MELENMPPLEYILTSVEENKEFWDRTDIPLGSIHFGHEIFEEDKNSVSIKHTVRLESSIINEENIEFFKRNIFRCTTFNDAFKKISRGIKIDILHLIF